MLRPFILRRFTRATAGLATTLVFAAPPLFGWQEPAPQPDIQPVDTAMVEPGRFDMGKMWTFESAPTSYFTEAYGLELSERWLDRVRLAALRLPNCSASFVSARGLVMTNHHCFRDNAAAVSEEGEDILETGFFAATEDAERRIPDLYVDQLVEIRDVTARVQMPDLEAGPRDAAAEARQQRIDALTEELDTETGLSCEITSLYYGAKYSAYCYRRYEDLRLVFAPELKAAHFGGDPDNFTYPRYSFDVTFMRVYDGNGEPFQPEHYLGWDAEGAATGEPVFVIGNPGATQRLYTLAQLEFLRDFEYPLQIGLIQRRVTLLRSYMDEFPETRPDIISSYLGFTNALKANLGESAALRDEEIMDRKTAFESRLRQAVQSDGALGAKYGDVWDEIESVRTEMAQLIPELTALNQGSDLHSKTLLLAALVFQYAAGSSNPDVDPEALTSLRETIESETFDPVLDQRLVQAQLEDALEILGESHIFVQTALAGRSPAEAAAAMMQQTALVDSAQRAGLLDQPQVVLAGLDPALRLMRVGLPRLLQLFQRYETLTEREELLTARLARAIFDVYGESIPPDATFTLRIADGAVGGYEYNGTVAPSYTTFYGMYDRHYAHGGAEDWALPERWLSPPPEFDLATPLNVVSTNDIIGGNSGSPVINQDGEVVGLIFDGNIESLSGKFIYTTDAARSVSVHAAGIVEALRDLYGAGRIVDELLTP